MVSLVKRVGKRVLEHFKGVKFHRGHVHFGQTSTDIALDKVFFKSALSVVRINAVLILQLIKNAFSQSLSKDRSTIAFYPDTPGPWYTVYFASHLAGLKITKDIEHADRVFIFQDKTHSEVGETLSPNIAAKALNHKIADISKTHVGKIFEQVFGYAVAVDPLRYHGLAVQKSDKNGTHDGKVVDCPLTSEQLEPNCIYQKLIDSTFAEGRSEDLRIAYVRGEIPVVFHKFKDSGKRFGTDYVRVDVRAARDVFSGEEMALLIKFCGAMGLDFGAVDVMRGKSDGRIYVVDVNKTCMPVLSLSLRELLQSQDRIAQSLLRLF